MTLKSVVRLSYRQLSFFVLSLFFNVVIHVIISKKSILLVDTIQYIDIENYIGLTIFLIYRSIAKCPLYYDRLI